MNSIYTWLELYEQIKANPNIHLYQYKNNIGIKYWSSAPEKWARYINFYFWVIDNGYFFFA